MLLEFNVARGLSAPHIIVIHAGKIVVNERIGMNHLNRAGKRERVLNISAAKAAELKHKERSYPFSAVSDAVLHSFTNNVIAALFKSLFKRRVYH